MEEENNRIAMQEKPSLVDTAQGKIMTEEEAQEAIRETIRRHGRFILASVEKPPIGHVEEFAGLPMRLVRYVTQEEVYVERCADIWGENWNFVTDFYFEVAVAD